AGYDWYEVSNWARPGRECAHNRCYWDGTEYVGIGCAAHGFTGGRRWWNPRTPERYMARIESGHDPAAGDEVLEPALRAEEAFALAQRTRSGVATAPGAAHAVEELADGGLLDTQNGRVVLTWRGRLLASDVTARLLLAGAATLGGRESG